MKSERFLVAFGLSLMAVVLTLFGLWLRSTSRSLRAGDLSVHLLGYTNEAETVSAVLSVTNRTSLTFLCWQGPAVSQTGESNDLPAVDLGMLNPKGDCTFLVPLPPDTNVLYVSFTVEEDSYWEPRSFRRKLFDEALRFIGLSGLAPQTAELTSPPIGRHELDTETDTGPFL